jgi:hypothetical protein
MLSDHEASLACLAQEYINLLKRPTWFRFGWSLPFWGDFDEFDLPHFWGLIHT